MNKSSSEMLALADAVLQEHDADQFVALLASYVESFEGWFAALPIDNLDASSPEELGLTKAVVEKHQEITKAAEQLQLKTSADLKILKMRGKQIMAYADQLPKRISVHAHRKG